MIEYVTGSIFDADTVAVVNPVNCVGVMGKGLALEFKRRYPGNFTTYKLFCSHGSVRPGKMLTHRICGGHPEFIVNFPTKRHWKDSSILTDIEAGIENLVGVIEELKIKSIALPYLGCGLGGLDWMDVKPVIETAFSHNKDLSVIVCCQ